MWGGEELDRTQRVRRLWLLFGVGVFLHGVVDPVITVVALTWIPGLGEANPLIGYGLTRGWPTFVGLHLILYVVVSVPFWGIARIVRNGSEDGSERIYYLISRGLVLVILWGLGLVMWNLYAILFLSS
jgi:hypothetical protein